jgi:hypothetical protein
MKSFDHFTYSYPGGAVCERILGPDPQYAYSFMKGVKRDRTPWVIPPGGQQNVTKYSYSGDPEIGSGWCEAIGNPSGSVQNCGGPNIFFGPIISANMPGERIFVLSSGSDNLTVHPGDTQRVMIAQIITRGTSNLNSVTKLKQLADSVKAFACGGFVIDIHHTSSNILDKFQLSQNNPNPFNSTTIINYQLPISRDVNLTVFNSLGEKIAVLVNEKQNAGEYKVEWDGTGFASGVYFYKLEAGDYVKTNKMILIK